MRNSFDYDHLASDAELAGGAFSHLVDCEDDDYSLVQSLTNEAEYIGRKLTTNKKVPGNIHKDHYREFWVNVLKPSDLVLKTISEGFSLLSSLFLLLVLKETTKVPEMICHLYARKSSA